MLSSSALKDTSSRKNMNNKNDKDFSSSEISSIISEDDFFLEDNLPLNANEDLPIKNS
jgi:hypothetical protein